MLGSCEQGNEISGFIKGREFLEKLSILVASEGLRSVELVLINSCTPLNFSVLYFPW
jgi:hypothetical protein